MKKLKTLNENLWEGRSDETAINEWLDNFVGESGADQENERLHALYLLSNFMYFGSRLMRELLKTLYRDLFKHPIVESIRKSNGDTTDISKIDTSFMEELRKTRFLGVGNPSESGSHLLYYFRQENDLPKTNFIHTHQIFARRRDYHSLKSIWPCRRGRQSVAFRYPTVSRYIFIDDFCGAGDQGVQYSEEIVEEIKEIGPDIFVGYYVLFGTTNGMNKVRSGTLFDSVECVYELDSSFKAFSRESRYFSHEIGEIDRNFAEFMCRTYGMKLCPDGPLGYGDCQLLIGFHHNTPDNTLPIIWYDELGGPSWRPIFRRYPKIYGWS